MTTWARKKKLIGYCRSLAVLQLPPKAHCHDLVTAIDVDKEDEEVKDVYPTQLFPLLTHLSFGERAIRSCRTAET
jgi:hypothetical protein